MPALFPILLIIAVFIFISAHATTSAPPRYRRREDYRGGYNSSRGYGDSGRSRDYGRTEYSGYSSSRSGGRRDRDYDRSRY